MSNDNRKTLNRGDTVAEIPLDYYERWDASTSAGMTFVTDEATGDCDSWTGMNGLQLDDHGTGSQPVWTPGKMTFAGTNTRGLGYAAALTAFQDKSHTIIGCGKISADASATSAWAGPEYYTRYNYITSAGGDASIFVNSAPTPDKRPTNSYVDKRATIATRMTRTAVSNQFDVDHWFGAGSKGTQDTAVNVNSALTGVFVGMANTSGVTTLLGEVYEFILYDRALSDAEVEAVLDYLSAKHQAENEDSASSVIAPSTERSWASPYIDPQGRALATYTPFNHKIDGFITPDAPRNANQEIDSRFPSSLPSLRFWYRSDYTAGMTFDTGDELAGGTVSSFTDITGNATSDTTASTDAAVTFHPGGAVKGGHPSLEGGTSGTPASLKNTATVAFNGSTGQQRLCWTVGTIGNAALNSSWGGPMTNWLFGGTYSAMATDMVAKPLIAYCTAATAGAWDIEYGIASGGPPADDGRIHIVVYRQTDTGTEATLETWYCGLKMPDRISSTIDATSTSHGIGALSTSNFDAEGAQFLEMGAAGESTATIQEYTDTQVDDLIRYLCARYGVDYMPAETPVTIGCWARQTTANALTDCCLWYEPSNIGAEKWPLHPLVAAYHTTPSNFDMNTGADATSVAMTLKTGELGRTSVSSDETVTTNQHMEMENQYVSTETTDFPADTLGMSSFHLLYMDSATTSSSGARCGNSITAIRFSGVSDTAIQHLSSNVSKNWSTVNEWILTGTSYAYDDDGTGAEGYPGATDADPGNYYYNKDRTMQTGASPAATNFNVQNWVNWDIADGTCRSLEHVTYKHPMDIHEIEQLRKYFAYKYPEMTRLRPHLVDADTISHWRFDGDFTDDVGSKTLTSSAGHTAGETPNGLVCEDHTGVTGGLTLVSGVQDADLDTHGAFTWCAAVYLESYPTASSSNWRPFVRSDPPSGGTSSANNSRYKFRVQNEDGTCRYNHQRDNKISEEFTTFAQVPLQQWTYVGVSRSADGTTVHVIIDETVETWTGLTAPTDGGNARFEMLEEWNGQDFDGQIYSAIFKEVETSPEGLRAMRREVFGNL